MAKILTQYARNITHDLVNKHDPIFTSAFALQLGSPSDPIFSNPIPVGPHDIVGIIGAGVGGLYAAMMLKSIGIPCEILEASDRTGGRLFTHKFSEEEHDYFDVGAMRFPKTDLMAAVFELFEYLELPVIPYMFQSENEMLLFNSVLRSRKEEHLEATDFAIPDFPKDYVPYSTKSLLDRVIGPFKAELKKDAEVSGRKEGWKLMMDYDQYSTKAFMISNPSNVQHEDNKPDLPYPLGVVNWLETFNTSTGSYTNAFTETVLSSLAFEENADWFCIDGGSSAISDAMVKVLENSEAHPPVPLKLKSHVAGISWTKETKDSILPNEQVLVTLSDGSTRSYAHVITTTTLPCLRTMNLEHAGLDYWQHSSLRRMSYGPSIKIGVKFKTNWWEDPKLMPHGPIVGGQSKTDYMVRVVVYPSYGEGEGEKKSHVLIVSYAWTSDALALAALMAPESESLLKARVLRDLVLIHGLDKVKGGAKNLEDQWLASFPYDWSRNPNTMGAFASFAPGQFSELYQSMTRPAANGRLHFAGEAISVTHAWIAGALEASRRAVAMIVSSSYKEKEAEFERKWGKDHLWHNDTRMRILAISRHHFKKERHGREEL